MSPSNPLLPRIKILKPPLILRNVFILRNFRSAKFGPKFGQFLQSERITNRSCIGMHLSVIHREWLTARPHSRGLESLTAGLQSLRLASRLKPWLRTIDGLGWLMAASHGLQVQTIRLTAANLHIQFLADRTNGGAYATVLRLSVAVVVVVMYCG